MGTLPFDSTPLECIKRRKVKCLSKLRKKNYHTLKKLCKSFRHRFMLTRSRRNSQILVFILSFSELVFLKHDPVPSPLDRQISFGCRKPILIYILQYMALTAQEWKDIHCEIIYTQITTYDKSQFNATLPCSPCVLNIHQHIITSSTICVNFLVSDWLISGTEPVSLFVLKHAPSRDTGRVGLLFLQFVIVIDGRSPYWLFATALAVLLAHLDTFSCFLRLTS